MVSDNGSQFNNEEFKSFFGKLYMVPKVGFLPLDILKVIEGFWIVWKNGWPNLKEDSYKTSLGISAFIVLKWLS